MLILDRDGVRSVVDAGWVGAGDKIEGIGMPDTHVDVVE